MGYCFVPAGTKAPWPVEKMGFRCSNEVWCRLLRAAYLYGQNSWKPRLPKEAENWPDPIDGIEWAYEYRNDKMDAVEVKELSTALKLALQNPGIEEMNNGHMTYLPEECVAEMIGFLEGEGANGIEWT